MDAPQSEVNEVATVMPDTHAVTGKLVAAWWLSAAQHYWLGPGAPSMKILRAIDACLYSDLGGGAGLEEPD